MALTIEERIDVFLSLWPRAEFGPAHIVLSDLNLEDGHVDWCAGLCRQWLGLEPRSAEIGEIAMWHSVADWDDHPKEEIEATLAFLTSLNSDLLPLVVDLEQERADYNETATRRLDLIQRLAGRVNTDAGSLCGEYHGGDWPDCNHPTCASARDLLEEAKYLTPTR